MGQVKDVSDVAEALNFEVGRKTDPTSKLRQMYDELVETSTTSG